MKTTFQRLKKEIPDKFILAQRYYSLLFVLNGLHLTERELQLVAFAAVKGNISYANFRQEFCEKYETSSPTINNMISKLKKSGVFIKSGAKVAVNPVIMLNFDNDIKLEINLTHTNGSKEGQDSSV